MPPMNHCLFSLTALLLTPLAPLCAADQPVPKVTDKLKPTGLNQQAAFRVDSIKLGGVFGHRIDTLIKGNLFKIDMEKDFLTQFRIKKQASGFRGTGLTLDAAVHLAAYSRDESMIRWKEHWIDELISTQDQNGYIGIIRPGPDRGSVNFDQSEKGVTLIALVNDYRIFGREKSLEAAKKLADEFIANFSESGPLWTNEYPLIALSEASGDPKYVDWVRATFFPQGRMSKAWNKGLGGDPSKPLKMEGQHVYRWCDVNISMLYLNRQYPHPALLVSYPQMIAWLKDGGALAPGSFALNERWRRSQTSRSGLDYDPEFFSGAQSDRTKCGENCAKRYVVQLLHLATQRNPDPYSADVIERTFYNGLFAGMSPTGRMLTYDLSVEGTRLANPMDYFCCPGNLRRALAYLPGYFYHQQGNQIYFNLYGESDARLKVPGGEAIRIVQSTDYPASGKIRVTVETDRPVEQELLFRVPAWCKNSEIRLNGEKLGGVQSGSFFPLRREWKSGDLVELDLPMDWRWMRGIREQEGLAVLARGPIIYSLNPFASGIKDYVDLPVNVDNPWFSDKQTASGGFGSILKRKTEIPGNAEYLKGLGVLEGITLDASSVSGPEADDSVPFGSKATVKGWLGTPKGPPNRAFMFNSFDHPNGRKIYLRLSDQSKEVDDELFGTEIHEKTVYPARWEAVKKGLDAATLTQVPDAGLDRAVLVKPMRASYDAETAQGELAGRPAWMSCSLAQTSKRRMEFRVQDAKFQDGVTPEVTLSVLYLDKGNCKASLIYDSTDPTVRQIGPKPGGEKPGGEFQIGNTGTIKRHDFNLSDARFGKYLRGEGTDFRLVTDKDVDFAILGAYLQPVAK